MLIFEIIFFTGEFGLLSWPRMIIKERRNEGNSGEIEVDRRERYGS